MSYLKIGILTIWFYILSMYNANCQTGTKNDFILDLGLNAGIYFDSDGNTYGLILEVLHPVWLNKSNSFSILLGLQEDFQYKLERGFEGASGSTKRNGVHMIIGPSFRLLSTRKLCFKIKYFGGWSYKSTDGKIVNNELNINRSYHDSYQYFSHGTMINAGYEIIQDLTVEAFIKVDLRRFTDGDMTRENPDMIFGLGFVKRINSR